MNSTTHNIDIDDIETAIRMLTKYVKAPQVEPLLSILKALKLDLHNESLFEQLTDTWRNLGVFQGAVLTYVPKFYTWIPDDIFGDDK